MDSSKMLNEVPRSGLEAFRRLFGAILVLLRRLFGRVGDVFAGKVHHDEDYDRDGCFEPPPDVTRRPDPCLYSQTFLMAQGIAVTWDNPDIVVANLDGTPAALPLDADREYLVRGTIHNASFDPALGVAVRCFVRSWGVDFDDRVPVEVDGGGQPATRIVHIGAWGSALAVFRWRTPNVAQGHYCLTVECYHPTDREPANNVGQENTDVQRTMQAGGNFTVVVPFFNRRRDVRAFRVAADAYAIRDDTVEFRLEQIHGPNGIPPRRARELEAAVGLRRSVAGDKERFARLVEEDAMRGARIRLTPGGRRERRGVGYRLFGYEAVDTLRQGNGVGAFPLPRGWTVQFPGLEQGERGAVVVVPPGDTVNIDVEVGVPADAPTDHRQGINVTVFDPAGRTVGGVTLDILVGV